MWLNTALFAAGVFLCQQLEILPGLQWSVAVLLLSLMAIIRVIGRSDSPAVSIFNLSLNRTLPLLLFGLGFSWAIVYGHWILNDRLLAELVKQPLQVTGTIVDLPRHKHGSWQFTYKPDSAFLQGNSVDVPARIRLSWYRTDRPLRSGQRWQLKVKLKPPTGLLNQGLFDYEGWLFQNGVGARGYVVNNGENRLVESQYRLPGFDILREKIRGSLAEFSAYPDSAALITALTVGDKSGISPQSWESFRALGINHLVAISGLHIGMIVMVVYWISGLLWRLSGTTCRWIPAPQVQAVSGLAAAFGYAGLAGFSLPTQRALIMLSVVLLARLFMIYQQPFRQLAVAVFIVLLFDPPAIVSPGFWLSFMAVTAIFLSVGQLDRTQGSALAQTMPGFIQKLKDLVVMQWSITLLLLPFSLLFFKQVSVVSPVVNLLLIPLFSFFVVPVAMLMTFLHQLEIDFVEMLFVQYLEIIELLLSSLEEISTVDWFVFHTSQISTPRFLGLLLPVVIWFTVMLPYRRLLSIFLLTVALLFPPAKYRSPDLRLTMLDVGQGTAVVLQAAGRVLMYDLGPRYGYARSATASVVIPWLHNQGINNIDLLVISHSDSDHAGDVEALLDAVRVEKIIAGERLEISRAHDLCLSGQYWNWQQTGFRFLSPSKHLVKDNNASCVLRIEHGRHSLLLTGDIEKSVESRLVKKHRDQLAADVVLVPHHGSKSSSSVQFVESVSARIALNSSGYLNRYGFPQEAIKKVWMKNGALFLNTADEGAVTLIFNGQQDEISHSSFLQKHARYWHWRRQKPG